MSHITVEIIRCVKCGQEKTSKEFRGRYDVCTSCSTFKSKKFIKVFCFYCHKPIYERTPHVIGMTAEFNEFVCRTCFNSGKYKPRGELIYYKSCRRCKEYFYTYETRQKVCTPQCYFSEKKSTNTKTHAQQKNEILAPKNPSFSSQKASKTSISDNTQTRLDSLLRSKEVEGSSK